MSSLNMELTAHEPKSSTKTKKQQSYGLKTEVNIMMYCEFIERTGWEESYMTPSDYDEKIEPVYMESTLDKNAFCEKFYKLHNSIVISAVECLVAAKSLEEKEAFIAGAVAWDDIENIHIALKNGFLKKFKRGEYKI